MIKKINECLLNGQDYLFMNQSIAINNITTELDAVSLQITMNFVFGVVIGLMAVFMICLAVMVRRHNKGASNVLILVAVIGVIILGYMTFFNINKKESLQSELKEKVAALNSLEQPNPQLFDACIQPNTLLKKLPNNGGVSSYKEVIGTGVK